MQFKINGKTPNKITFLGKNVSRVLCNDVLVWISGTIDRILQTVTGSSPIEITESVGDNLYNYNIKGNTYQSDIPNLENKIDIQNVGVYNPQYNKYMIPIRISGQNMFDVNNAEVYRTNAIDSYDISNNKITVTSKRALFANIAVKLDLPDGIKTFKCGSFKHSDPSMTTNRMTLAYYINNSRTVVQHMDNGQLYHINIENEPGKTYVLEFYATYAAAVTNTSEFSHIVINEGVTEGLYTHYVQPIITDIMLDEPLRRVEDITDEIDYKNSKLIRRIKEYQITGDESISNSEISVSYSCNRYKIHLPDLKDGTYESISNLLPVRKHDEEASDKECILIGNNSIYIELLRSRMTSDTVNGFKQWIKNIADPITVVYPLKTPVETSIQLPNIPTLEEYTKIDILTDIPPNSLQIKYYKRKEEQS